MQKLTLGSLKATVSDAVRLCATDPLVVAYINEAQEMLMNRGRWVGTWIRYKITAPSGKITWPRQINTIEAVAFDRSPGVIHNGWYEFLPNGVGLLECDDNLFYKLIDRDPACTFDDIVACVTNRKLRVYCDLAADADAELILQGYDENMQWIRTLDGEDYIDGEKVAASTAGTLSTKFFTHITGVIKPVTNGPVRIYEYNNTTAANVKSIGYYEPDEQRPIYRRSLLPGLENMSADEQVVTVQAKLRHIPVVNDNDWLILGNARALILGAMAVAKERKDLLQEAEIYWGKALKELEQELRNYQGDGVVVPPKFQTYSEFGAGRIGERMI
jgi:hypothetical protein